MATGATDLGIAGKDVLNEHGGNGLYQPLDLGIVCCRMMAVREGYDYEGQVKEGDAHPRRHQIRQRGVRPFRLQRRAIDLIKLCGSMELAFLVGLSDVIVDLVSAGGTLKANGLVAVEHIGDIGSRLEVNRAALKLSLIQPVIGRRSARTAAQSCSHRNSGAQKLFLQYRRFGINILIKRTICVYNVPHGNPVQGCGQAKDRR